MKLESAMMRLLDVVIGCPDWMSVLDAVIGDCYCIWLADADTGCYFFIISFGCHHWMGSLGGGMQFIGTRTAIHACKVHLN